MISEDRRRFLTRMIQASKLDPSLKEAIIMDCLLDLAKPIYRVECPLQVCIDVAEKHGHKSLGTDDDPAEVFIRNHFNECLSDFPETIYSEHGHILNDAKKKNEAIDTMNTIQGELKKLIISIASRGADEPNEAEWKRIEDIKNIWKDPTPWEEFDRLIRIAIAALKVSQGLDHLRGLGALGSDPNDKED